MKKPCIHQHKCSGCPRIHLPAEKQLAMKASFVLGHVKAFLPRQPGRDAASASSYTGFNPIVKSPLPFGYRTSVKLCLGEEANGRRSLGLYKRDSKTVIDIPGCPVQHDLINAAIAKLFGNKKNLPAPLYFHTRGFQEGRLKFVTFRICPETGELGIILSHTGVTRRPLTQWLKALDLTKTSVYESILTRDDKDLVIGPHLAHLAGKETLRYTVGGHSFDLPPAAFFQANFSLSGSFVEHITASTKDEAHTLLDLYGGFGAYSFASHQLFKKIHVVDGNETAINAARAAAKVYGYEHIQGSYAAVEDFLGNRLSPQEIAQVTHVIVNPPRAGISAKVRSGLCAPKFKNLKNLTYVSCNPETLGRDLSELTTKGKFRVVSVTPFDMFPQTEHVEVVVKLRR